MIEARRPFLVFSRVSLTMMQPSLLSLLSALATKRGMGGKKQPLLLMPPSPIKEIRCRRPGCNVYVNRAVYDGSTDAQGQCQGKSSIDDEDDDDSGGNDDGDNNWGHCLDS